VRSYWHLPSLHLPNRFFTGELGLSHLAHAPNNWTWKSKKTIAMTPRLERGASSLQQSSGCVTAAHRARYKLQPDPRTDQRYDRLPTASRLGGESMIPTVSHLASKSDMANAITLQ
jgi:hypothetical protein